MSLYSGTVQKSSGEGTRLGFPTANIPLNDTNVSGIYAAWVAVRGERYPAAVYADTRRNLLESHILDFSNDLVGEVISVELLKKIRDEMVFADMNEAKTRIAQDVGVVRDYFRTL